jgi:protein arginine kinase activator
MLCQACKNKNATVHYKTNVNGKVNELFLCAECAKNYGVGKKPVFEPIEVIDGFFGKGTDDIFGGLFAGMMNDSPAKSINETSVCPVCGMRFSEFLHGGKIGCGECYKTFSLQLKPTVKRLHGNVEHCGKVPEDKKGAISARKKIDELKAKLQTAIENQEYEMAAKYRDEIQEIENGEVK